MHARLYNAPTTFTSPATVLPPNCAAQKPHPPAADNDSRCRPGATTPCTSASASARPGPRQSGAPIAETRAHHICAGARVRSGPLNCAPGLSRNSVQAAGLPALQVEQALRQHHHPLPHCHCRTIVLHQVRCRLHHALHIERSTPAEPLARICNPKLLHALLITRTCTPIRQNVILRNIAQLDLNVSGTRIYIWRRTAKN